MEALMSCLERFSIAVYAGMAGKRCRLKAALLDLTNQDISELPDKECREGSFSCCTRARTRALPDRPIGRASYEGETATGHCAHTALGVSTSASSTLRSALTCAVFKGLSSERRLLSHHGPGIALPHTPAVLAVRG